jgi:hypothetical protein
MGNCLLTLVTQYRTATLLAGINVTNIIERIEAWFVAHEDGEFVCCHRGQPFQVVGRSQESRCAIYTTKPQLILQLLDGVVNDAVQCGLIGRYGLPNDLGAGSVLSLLYDLDVHFIGDMDPVDLMIFAWLRRKFTATQWHYLGINDTLMESCDLQLMSFSMPLSEAESDARQLLEDSLPDLVDLVGLKCHHLLQNNLKVEIECLLEAKASLKNASHPLGSGGAP